MVYSFITASFLYSFMVYKWSVSLLNYIDKHIGNFVWTRSVASKKWFQFHGTDVVVLQNKVVYVLKHTHVEWGLTF